MAYMSKTAIRMQDNERTRVNELKKQLEVAVASGDPIKLYDAHAAIVGFATNAKYVPASTMLSAGDSHAYLEANRNTISAMKLDRAWSTTPDRLRKRADAAQVTVQAFADRLNKALASNDERLSYPMEWSSDAFYAAALRDVYLDVAAECERMDRDQTDRTTQQKFDVVHQSVIEEAMRLAGDHGFRSTSVTDGLVDDAKRVAYATLAKRIRNYQEIWYRGDY